MRKLKLFFLIAFVLFYSCSSSDKEDCVKTITIHEFYSFGNQIYFNDREQEVPCDFPEPDTEPVNVAPPILENFTYEVISFEFIPDTGNNTSRLKFEIKLNNNNDFTAKGIPAITIDIDGLVSSNNYSSSASNPCNQISANSSCIMTYDKESSLDLGIVNDIKLLDVKYYKTN